MSVLVVAAHPDDEILGAGGTLRRHVLDGETVHAVIVGEGAGSRYEDDVARKLEKSIWRAAQEIGFASVRCEGLPDQRLDAMPLIEVTQRIEAVVDEVRPTIVYTHFPGDVNADHGVVSRATWTACRPYVCPQLQRFAVFETPSSTEWAWPTPESTFRPTSFVDISVGLDAKLRAMACYETELRDYPHPRSERALRERAAYWGSVVGRTAVEPFQVLRELR